MRLIARNCRDGRYDVQFEKDFRVMIIIKRD